MTMSRRFQVLVVEDDPAIRRGLVDALRFANYETLETGDGARFVCHTRPEDQDVVAEMVAREPAGRHITVTGSEENEYALHFRFAD